MRPLLYAYDLDTNELAQLERVASQLGCLVLPYDSVQDVLDSMSSLDNQVLVLSTKLPFLETLERIRSSLAGKESIELLLLANNWTSFEVVRAIREGVTDVLDSPTNDSTLLKSIDEALARDALRKENPSIAIPLAIKQKLSHQECKILTSIANGRTTKQIGAELDLSVRTIHYRMKSILKKLGAANRADAIEILRRTLGVPDFNFASNFPSQTQGA